MTAFSGEDKPLLLVETTARKPSHLSSKDYPELPSSERHWSGFSLGCCRLLTLIAPKRFEGRDVGSKVEGWSPVIRFENPGRRGV